MRHCEKGRKRKATTENILFEFKKWKVKEFHCRVHRWACLCFNKKWWCWIYCFNQPCTFKLSLQLERLDLKRRWNERWGERKKQRRRKATADFFFFLSVKEWQSSEIRYLVVDLDDQKLVKKWSRRKLQKARVGTKVTVGQTTIDQKTVKNAIVIATKKKSARHRSKENRDLADSDNSSITCKFGLPSNYNSYHWLKTATLIYRDANWNRPWHHHPPNLPEGQELPSWNSHRSGASTINFLWS